MVDSVEKFFEVDIHRDLFSFLDVLLRLADCIVRVASRPETVAVFREGGVKHRLKYLQDALLDEPIEHTRNPELSGSSTALRDFLPSYWFGLGSPIEQRRPYCLPVFNQLLRQLIHRHPIDTGTALVLPHSLQRRFGIA